MTFMKTRMKLMMILVASAAVSALSSCGSAPKADAGVGYSSPPGEVVVQK